MAIDAVKIPQNVYVEDRIIGPVTLRQLLLTGIGTGIGYALFATASKAGVTNVVVLGACWIPAVVAAAFSFLKINDLTLMNIILLMIEGMNKPSKRTWEPGTGLSINIITKAPKKGAADASASAKPLTKLDRIAEMTRELEARERDLKNLTVQHETTESIGLENSSVSNSLPVNPARIKADPLQAHLSLDGVMTAERLYHVSSRHNPTHTW
ncbi:MAG: PrgI family protein [Candidatus Peribacteraceae bacterium]